ncbi:MarR family winged helix-turn-helix transcriptional regulator [Maricaulis sp.]|uniref:MarR family winged helix-turn-helix transcriptional regulator n=1 Tax=Maricaulis sp. TaxID=1486257 RepID=UPI003A95CF51
MSDHDEILVSLRRITRAIDLQSKRLVKATGLTAPQLVVIDTLRKRGDLSPSAIARAVSLSQATITSILDRLTQAGLVERVKSDTDKRVVMAHLTETGIAAGETAPELLQAGFLRSFRELQPWEQNMLIASLQRIAELMDAENLDASPFLDTGEITQ